MSAASQSKGVINEVLEVCQSYLVVLIVKASYMFIEVDPFGALYGTNLYVSQKLSFELDVINYQLYQNLKLLGNIKI